MIDDSNEATDLAPLLPKRPTSPIAPSSPAPTRPQTLATGTPKPVVKSKLANQRESIAPVVAQLKQRVSASQSASVGKAVGALQQLRANQEELQDAVAQELALLMSPNAFMQGVMLRTGQIISEESAIDVPELFGGIFDGAREQLAQLAPACTSPVSAQLQAWLDAETEAGTRAIASAVVDTEVD